MGPKDTMKSNAELRALLKNDTRAFIVALAKNFPALRHWPIGPWDSMRFRALGIAASHGERCAVQFVLGVWNYSTKWDDPALVDGWIEETAASEAKLGWDPKTAKIGRFDALDALSVWDDGNIAAFVEWAKAPIWP